MSKKITTKTKICAGCKKRKYTMCFYTTKAGTPTPYCHQCRVIRSRKWRLAHLEQARRLTREANKKYRLKYLPSYNKYIKNNPEKRRAKDVIHDLTRKGKMERKPCEVCGDIKAHGHHADYSKPKEVKWLCAVHHKAEHQRLLSIKNKQNER